MQNHWQDFAAIALAGVAAIYLGRRVWPARSPSGGSGCASGCAGCSTDGAVPNAAVGRGANGLNSEIIPIQRLAMKTRTAEGDADAD